MLSVYVLRFMTLGSKINSKFTNTSGLLTEQVSKSEIPFYHGSGKRMATPPVPRRGQLPPLLGRGHLMILWVEVCRQGLHSVRASSPGRCGGGAGKSRRSCNYFSGI